MEFFKKKKSSFRFSLGWGGIRQQVLGERSPCELHPSPVRAVMSAGGKAHGAAVRRTLGSVSLEGHFTLPVHPTFLIGQVGVDFHMLFS